MSERPIWAPWRIEYIISGKSEGCFLCGREKIAEKDDEFMVLFRGKEVFAILNKYPYNSGHLMVAPYRHIGSFDGLTKSERYELWDLIAMSEKVLSDLMKPEGFNIGMNLGKAAGAGVEEHLHVHVVPRWIGDNNFMPVICDTRVVPQALNDTAELIKKRWAKICQ